MAGAFTQEEMAHLRNALTKAFPDQFKMAELDSLIGGMDRLPFVRGQKLIRQGERGDSFYIIGNGSVGVYKRSLGIFRQRVATRRPGEFVGEIALVEDVPRNASIIADGDGEAFVVSRATFNRVLLKNPDTAEIIRQAIRNRHLQDQAAGFS